MGTQVVQCRKPQVSYHLDVCADPHTRARLYTGWGVRANQEVQVVQKQGEGASVGKELTGAGSPRSWVAGLIRDAVCVR